jgi:hypothetical protein
VLNIGQKHPGTPHSLEEYQTPTVGALGFAGVILALLTNARLNRKQHTRQVEHERTTLKAALSAELSIIRDSYDDRIKMFRGAPEGNRDTSSYGYHDRGLH